MVKRLIFKIGFVYGFVLSSAHAIELVEDRLAHYQSAALFDDMGTVQDAVWSDESNLWLLTTKGLYRFDNEADRFFQIHLGDQAIDGYTHIGTDGESIFVGADNSVIRVKADSELLLTAYKIDELSKGSGIEFWGSGDRFFWFHRLL